MKPQVRFVTEFGTTSTCSAWCLLLPHGTMALVGGPLTLWLLLNCQVAVGTHRYPSGAGFMVAPLKTWLTLTLWHSSCFALIS